MLLETVLYDRAHQELSFDTKFDLIGPCVVILRPRNHQNLAIVFGTLLQKCSKIDSKTANISKTNCFRAQLMFLNDSPAMN